MKRTLLSITLLFASTTLLGMDSSRASSSSSSASSAYTPAPLEAYPTSIGFIPEEQLAALCAEPLPEEVQERVEALLRAHPRIADLCSLPKQHAAILAQTPITGIPSSRSQHNYVFATTEEESSDSAVVKIASFGNALRTSVSALGVDPYSPGAKEKGSAAIISSIPRFQHLSTLVTEELLRRAATETVTPVQTWAYHLPEHPDAACDQNYIVVQRKLPSEYKQFSTLSPTEKRDVLGQLDLAELWRVLKYANLWNPSEENLWVNSSRQSELAYPDGEKPNNEGSGSNAKFHIAIFGQSLSKARHNIRNPWDGGHRVFENILQAHCTDRVAEWMALYNTDQDVK